MQSFATVPVEATAPAALLDRLRTATHALHERLDAFVGADMARSVDAYIRFLRASLVAVASLEGAIFDRLGADFPAARAPRLIADLAALDVHEAHLDMTTNGSPSEAAAFGQAYVLEGSALGGVFLAARTRASLGAGTPVAYLSLRGDETATRWRWFLRRLAEFDRRANEAEREEAVAAAVATFATYELAFAAAAAAKRCP